MTKPEDKPEHPEHPHGAPPGQAKPDKGPVPKPDHDLPEPEEPAEGGEGSGGLEQAEQLPSTPQAVPYDK